MSARRDDEWVDDEDEMLVDTDGSESADGDDTAASPDAPGAAVVTISATPSEGPPQEDIHVPPELPLLTIRDAVAFPGTVMPLSIGRDKSKRLIDDALAGNRMIGVVTQRVSEVEDPELNDLYRVGTACSILKLFKLRDGAHTIIVHGLTRLGIETITHDNPYLVGRVHPAFDPPVSSIEVDALMHNIRHDAHRVIELSPNVPDEAKIVLDGIKTAGGLADFLAANLSLSLVHKQELLETFDVVSRLRKVHAALAGQLEVLELSQKLQAQVRSQMEKTQREYYLREQMKAIQSELGQGDTRNTAVDKMRERVEKASMPDGILAEAKRELERLDNIPQASPEYSVTLDYLEWLVSLPWNVSTEDHLDLAHAREVLDEDHYDLDKIKKRIIEFLAVQQLRRASKPIDDGSPIRVARGPILCFSGPPGVGKTSLGQSIARAMGRKFIRMSLGGVRDEADIRGHRRTYIGALPGRILQELRKAGSNNPVFMLDEVDKIGQDFRGDPSSALLEVLDPAQNSTFTDHYLDVPFDLSRVLFIATANYMDAIPDPLRDRMEIIRLSGYTHQEKLFIAKRYLVPRQLAENALLPDQVQFDDAALREIISGYTYEAGVRNLEREIGSVCRAQAALIVGQKNRRTRVTKNSLVDDLGQPRYENEVALRVAVPGVVTGLAFTPVGGEILFVEATRMPGNGSLNLTGQIGAVMRESAQAAFTIVRSRSKALNIDPADLKRNDFHLHVPAGAVPKDGPSAGVAMLTALVSLLTGKTVDPATGMTGEITLRGLVLPIGGVKEKVLAAHRAGLTRVILPERNRHDTDEIPKEVCEAMEFVYVSTIDELLEAAVKQPTSAARSKPRARPSPKRQAPGSRGAARSRRSPAGRR